MPIHRFFKISVGMIGIQPSEFWNSSPQEIYMAIDGFKEFNQTEEKNKPMSSEKLKEMSELYPD